MPNALTAVVLDDQRVVEGWDLDLLAAGELQDAAAQVLPIHDHPVRRLTAGEHLLKFLEVLALATLRPDRDHVVGTNQERRDIGLATVDSEVTVPHDLAGVAARLGEAHPEDDVVQTRLQNLDQVV